MSNLKGGLWGQEQIFTTRPAFKRDATQCPTGYMLCPSSLNGGCCSTDQVCGTSSCYATTSAPQSACGKAGYVACGLNQGGGCCPSGFSCQANGGCSPSSGSSYSQDCGPSSYLCPEAAGYGCCRSDLACGVGYCYITSYMTVSLTVTFTTTDSNSQTETITTIVPTAYVPQTLTTMPPSPASSSIIAQITPTSAFKKVVATSSPSSAGGGLSTGSLAGIITAAIVILIVIIVASFIILRRLNSVVKQSKAMERPGPGPGSKNKSSSKPSGGGGSGGTGSKATEIDYDNMSVDPLMMCSSDTMNSPALARPSAVHNAGSGIQSNEPSPPIPAPYQSPFENLSGYHQIPTSDSQYFDAQHRSTPYSQISPQSPPMDQYAYNEDTYFPDPALRDQNIRYGHLSSRPSIQLSHGRHWSDSSVESQRSNNSSGLVELDGSTTVEPSSALQRAMHGMGFSRPGVGHRRGSSEINLLGHTGSLSNGSGFRRQEAQLSPGFERRLENVVENDLDHSLTTTGKSPHSQKPVGESSTMSPVVPGELVQNQPSTGNDKEENVKKEEQSHSGADTVLETSHNTNTTVEKERMRERALNLEQELERLEGQKIRGGDMDLLRDRS